MSLATGGARCPAATWVAPSRSSPRGRTHSPSPSATHPPASRHGIVEKLESWSDESAFTPDELLTWVTAYWVAGTIGTSFATYVEPVTLPDWIDTPTVLSVFPCDIKPEPRSYAEAFLNVCDYVEHPAGGHFAAWEQPEAYAGDVHRAVTLGWQR